MTQAPNKTSYILVAEDDTDDQYLLQMAFRESGYHDTIEFVCNGLELLSCLLTKLDAHQHLPVIILLDLNMPIKGGKDTLRELKQHRELKRIPVIVFSTTDELSQIQACYDLGANTYIIKPPEYKLLLQTVSILHKCWFNTASHNVV